MPAAAHPGGGIFFQWGGLPPLPRHRIPCGDYQQPGKKFVSWPPARRAGPTWAPYVGYQHSDALNRIAEVLYPEDYAAPLLGHDPSGARRWTPSPPGSALRQPPWPSEWIRPPSRALDGFPRHAEERLCGPRVLQRPHPPQVVRLVLPSAAAGTAPALRPHPQRAAGAILLHNYYKNVLQKPPSSLGLLEPEQHPLGFLRILCDELQEWNWRPTGILDRQRFWPPTGADPSRRICSASAT